MLFCLLPLRDSSLNLRIGLFFSFVCEDLLTERNPLVSFSQARETISFRYPFLNGPV